MKRKLFLSYTIKTNDCAELVIQKIRTASAIYGKQNICVYFEDNVDAHDADYAGVLHIYYLVNDNGDLYFQ